MSIFTNDSFTGTAGTLLENHTGETGATWTRNSAFASGSAAITAAGRLRGNIAANSIYYESATPASADYDVEADLYLASTAASCGILGRASTSAATYYLLDYESSGNWNLYTVVNGTTSNQHSFSQTLTVGQTYHIRLSMRGSLISCYVNGSLIIQITDTNISTAGRASVFFSAADTDSTGSHLDNFTGSIPATVGVTDPNVFFSPCNWRSDGAGPMLANNINTSSTYAQTNNPGAYLKFSLTAASAGVATLLLDTTPLNGITAANCPTLAISVDGAAFTTPLLAYATGTTRLLLAGNLSAGAHTVAIFFRSVTLSSSLAMGDRWNTPASAVKITGLELDGKGSATAAQTLHAKRMLVFGDSITEGADAVGSNNANADQDATQTYAQLLAVGLDAEVGVIGFSSQGWTVAGYGNVPKFYDTATPSNSTFDKYWAATSRVSSGTFAPALDFLVVIHGTNDAAQGASDAAVTSAVSAWLPAVRADAPSANIFVVIPFDGGKRAAIVSGVAAIIDPKLHLIDLGTAIQPTLAAGGAYTNDALHPNVRGHAVFASMLINQIRQALNPAGPFVASTGEFLGSSVELTDGGFAV
jgi:lysophospholipase L1-like esterase